ncbi:MAG TPA: DUF488 domain-containing protein [Chitinophagaceae bacterium]
MDFFTIGVFNSTEQEFFNKLINNQIDTFCDIRQRRGVRGATYAFVNSNRLQDKLNRAGIKYRHELGLAPTVEIRSVQKGIDLEKGETNKERQQLAQSYKTEYISKILNKFDFENFISELRAAGANRVVFFCVEEFPEACHRSLVAQRLHDQYGFRVSHL